MQNYSYKARNRSGNLVKGSLEALDLRAARKSLTQQQLTVIQIKTQSPLMGWEEIKENFRYFTHKITPEEFLVFIQELQTTYAVGIPLLKGLAMIQEQIENPILKESLGKVIGDVKDGSSLAEAFEKQPRVFEPLFVNLVRAGEASGKLEALLDQAAILIERKAENRDKVKAAMFYPKMVIGFMAIVFLVVVYFVIPKMEAFYSKFSGAQLPAITLFVVGISKFFTTYWYLILLSGFGATYLVKKILKNPSQRERLDALLLKIPILGTLLLQIEIYGICTVLEILMNSGMSIVHALINVAHTASNRAIAKAIENCSVKVQQGERISEGFSDSKYFPNIFTSLVAVGEESGKLEAVLVRTGKFYKGQVDYKLNNFSKVIEPILLVFIMGGILVLALAVFMPIWKSSQLIKPR